MSREYEQPYIEPPEVIHVGLDGTVYDSWEDVERAGQTENLEVAITLMYISWLDAVQECIYAHFEGGHLDLETFDQNWLYDKLYPRYQRGMTPENMAKLFVRYIQFVKSLDNIIIICQINSYKEGIKDNSVKTVRTDVGDRGAVLLHRLRLPAVPAG